MRLSSRETRLLTMAFGMTAAFLVLAYLVRPAGRRWQEKEALAQRIAVEVRRAERLIGERAQLTERLNALNRNLLTRIPLARKESEFLSEIDKVARQTNVHLLRLDPQGNRDYGPFTELSVELDAEANLGNLVRFLYDIRESSVLLVVEKMRLEPKADRSALLKSSLIISSLFAKE